MDKQVRKGTYGMKLFFPVGIDLTGWVRLRLNITKQDGTVVLKSDNDGGGIDISDKDVAGVAAPTAQKIRWVPTAAEAMFDSLGVLKIVGWVEFAGAKLKTIPQWTIEVVDEFDG